jgi:hypothetical protein
MLLKIREKWKGEYPARSEASRSGHDPAGFSRTLAINSVIDSGRVTGKDANCISSGPTMSLAEAS